MVNNRKFKKEQLGRFPDSADKWTRFDLSTAPANRPLAEEGMNLAYNTVSLKNPKIVWCTSPLANGLTRSIILKIKLAGGRAVSGATAGASPANKIWDKVWGSMGASAEVAIRTSVWPSWTSVKSSVEDSVRATIKATVRDSVWAKVGDSVWAAWTSVGDLVWNSVWESVKESVGIVVGESVEHTVVHSVKKPVTDKFEEFFRSSVRDLIGSFFRDSAGGLDWSEWGSGYGQDDPDWLGMHDHRKQILQLKNQLHTLEGLWLQAKSAGWFLPHQNLCWMAERHNILHLKNNRLHCETGPALAFPDGWNIWALNGIRMKPEYVMTPAEKLTPEIALKEDNVDQRRELVRKIGVLRLIHQGKVTDTLVVCQH